MSEAPRRPGRPVWQRGRTGRFWGGFWDYARTAWWGIVSARALESRPLRIAQAVIVRDVPEPEVLLSIRSDLFGWELPGGTLEVGESPEQAVVREVREETGLEIECTRHVGDWVRSGFRPHTAHVFRARIIGGTETPSHETPRLAWFAMQRPPDLLFPWYAEPLREAIDPSESPVRGEDWQGAGTIWQAMKIDLVMRWRGLPDPGERG